MSQARAVEIKICRTARCECSGHHQGPTALDTPSQSRQQHVVIGGSHRLTLLDQLSNRTGGLINHGHALPGTRCDLDKFVLDPPLVENRPEDLSAIAAQKSDRDGPRAK